ncbi:efflux RND transporter periplasmic adaptor subunit [Aliidiomarina sanyensis]|nr:efflux RND transporter periplasmic adaptor subunit [Aliidiomarina sanyensis]
MVQRIVAGVLGVCLLGACSDGAEPSSSSGGEERRIPIAAYEVVPRDLSRQLMLSATVEPRIQVTLTSRTQGIVADIEIGESIEPQQPLFTLANMNELVIRPGVSERDIRHLEVGMTVPVRLDSMPDKEIEGTIRRIFPAADQSSRLLRIEVLLPEQSFEQGVRPGFLARLPLIVDPRPDALAVPAAAVGESGDQRYI